MLQKENRIIYLDVLRTFAVFCMIVLHTASKQLWAVPTVSFEWQVLNVYDSLVRFCVPVFVMISGALLLNPDRNISLKRMFKKNILRISIAYFFWSFCYAVYTSKIYLDFNVDTLYAFLKNTIAGHYHLWFIPVIIGLYIIIPILRKITTDRKITEYFLVLSFIFTMVLPALKLLFPKFNVILNLFDTSMRMEFVVGYTLYFVAGHYFCTYEFAKRTKRIIWLLGLLSVFFTIIMTSMTSIEAQKPIQTWYSNLLPNTALTSFAVFLLFKEIQFAKLNSPNVVILSNLCFGIYLVHDVFNIIMVKTGINTLLFNPIFSVPVLAMAVFISSLLVAYILSQIPIMKKYII